ncbi:MAG: HPr(Ser) kinase/phosphatase [Nitrospirota bacterium]|nr:HPr(Ser) kinase/phosphatase [Nitrospirota bacterium]
MKVTVKDVISKAAVLAGGKGIEREVVSPQIIRPDLDRWAGYRDISGSIVQLTPAQNSLLSGMGTAAREKLCRAIMRKKPAAVVLSGGKVCRDLLACAESARVPVVKCGNIPRLARVLRERLTPRTGIHGVLVQVFGVGVLIIGESAIGKSEAALDLVLRGHKLVADDVVMLERTDEGILGRPTDIGADLLEIRGLGIINVKALYGDSATIEASVVGIVVELEEWKEGAYYSLLGLRERRHRLLGMNMPYLKLPIKPGRNMATLIEVAARNQTLKQRGIYTARELGRKLKKRLSR